MPEIRKNARTGMYVGRRCRNNVRSERSWMSVSSKAENTMVPRLGPVERVRAAWMVCVEVGKGGGASGL
jgi:hypothetical protein